MHKKYDSNSNEFRIELFKKYLRKNIEKKSEVKIPNFFTFFLDGGIN